MLQKVTTLMIHTCTCHAAVGLYGNTLLIVSLLSGPDPQVHPLTFGVDISEEPLRGLEEVEESLLPLEYDRDELLERYHVNLHSVFL